MKNFDIQLINDASLRHKWQNLCAILQKAGENGLLVAFSGGTDSTLLLAAAHYAGVSPLMGVSLVTPLQTPGDRENILSLQESLDLPIIFLESDPLTLPEVRMNRKDRCYHCKKQLFSQILETAKTKRYAYARLRRMVLWAYLELYPQEQPERIPYLRPLAANETGRMLLGQMRKAATLPVVMKTKQIRALDETAQKLFELEIRGGDLYALAYPELSAAAGGSVWREAPVLI